MQEKKVLKNRETDQPAYFSGPSTSMAAKINLDAQNDDYILEGMNPLFHKP